jgi:hypothetical protein
LFSYSLIAEEGLMLEYCTRDAKQAELNTACTFLKVAVLALRDMIAILSDDEVALATSKKNNENELRAARDEAKNNGTCKVPHPVSTSASGGKPACLVTFGGVKDTEMHPAPDPLLLVLRAANIFGIMAGMKMLASGASDDSDICSDDIMWEERCLEVREQVLRDRSWSDLARGLGQPNG